MYHKAGGLAGPEYGFGTDDRFQRLGRQLSDASELPGPGSYSADSTLGSQRSSRLTTQPAFGFGSSNREHSARIFVSDMHAKASGPAAYAQPPNCNPPNHTPHALHPYRTRCTRDARATHARRTPPDGSNALRSHALRLLGLCVCRFAGT